MSIKTFAQAEEVLAKALPGYESRPQQQRLAQAVETVLAEGGQGLLQAGCGVGKSLGSLIPVILSGERVVVATATIALMEQYAEKDIPFLAENLGVPFTWALVKGRSNYFCHAKAANADEKFAPQIQALRDEVMEPGHDGDREHFKTPVTKQEFSNVASSSNECPGKRECPFGDICFAEIAKAKGREAQVVITNTAMLMTDLVVSERSEGAAQMLGEYDVVVIDEAHETEEIATNALSDTFRKGGFEKFVKEVSNFSGTYGDLIATAPLNEAIENAWSSLREGRFNSVAAEDESDVWSVLANLLLELGAKVAKVDLSNLTSDRKVAARRAQLASRASNMAWRVRRLLSDGSDVSVRWVESEKNLRGVSQLVIKTAPLRVGPFLQENLWTKTVILVSATLSVGSDFSFIKDRLGLEAPTVLDVGSPFDYSSQARLFIPTAQTPNPKARSAWQQYVMQTTIGLVDAAGGGALLLFTSRSAMQDAHDSLAEVLEERGHTVLMQGQGSNKDLAAAFQADTHSVLFALKSFFTGVDFAGETCRLVIIDKMPFPVPTEPVFEARSQQIEREGGNAFSKMAIPSMSLTLIQGFGRLIRTQKDQGVVAILDSRLASTGYGRGIVKTLPGAPKISSVSEAKEFFAA